MSIDDIAAWIDKMFHDHGDILIKIFSVLAAILLLCLWFLATQRFPTGNNGVSEFQQQLSQ